MCGVNVIQFVDAEIINLLRISTFENNILSFNTNKSSWAKTFLHEILQIIVYPLI